MNKIYIAGRITKDIELKEYGDLKVVNNTIAVYGGKDNKDQSDITYFFDFKAFNYVANKLSSQAQKGVKIAIEGVLRQDKWDDNGQVKSKVVIYAENVEIIKEFKQEKPEEQPNETNENLPF